MNISLRTVARMELTAVARLWWIRLFTAAYALTTVAMASASGVIGGGADPREGFARLTVAVLPLALMLIPLASLLVGTLGAGEGDTVFVLSQPVTRAEYVLGRWCGQAVAVCTSVVIGFGTGGVIVAVLSGSSDVHRIVTLMVACTVMGLAFLSIASWIASAVSRRSAAIGVAAFVWFVAVMFYDAAMLGIALWATGPAGAHVLFVSVFGNIVDLVRVLTLLMAGTPHLLGAAGDSWLRALGGPGQAAVLSATMLVAWILLPLVAAIRVHATREV